MAERHAKNSARTMQGRLPVLLIVLFVFQAGLPMASSEGSGLDDMELCTEIFGGVVCDDRTNFDDGTDGIESWVEGMYHFNMTSPTEMEFQASWAIKEWDKSALGFTGSLMEDLLQVKANIGPNDGLPADVLRASFGNLTDEGDPSSPTVQEKLLSEVNGSVSSFLTSWGGATTPQTNWSSEIFLPDDSGVAAKVECSTDVNQNSDGNSFSPPICISTSVTITLDAASTYGTPARVSESNLNEAFEALLVMGAEVSTQFSVNVEPGFKGTYAIQPPSYSTITEAGGTGGSLVGHSEGLGYNSGKWEIDNRNPPNAATSVLPGNLMMSLGFRETNSTSVVSIEPDARSLDLWVTLNLADESSASLEVVAALYQIQSSTLNQWGVAPLMPSEKATIPVITSDGIRMAYDTGLLELDTLADAIPISEIGDAISSSNEDLSINMDDMQWTSVALSPLSPGGLNYTHTAPCENPGGNYCTAGPIAMGDNFPVYLRSISQLFPLSLSDLLGGNLGEGAGFMNSVNGDDLGVLLDSGVSFSTTLSDETMDSFIGSMLPSGLSADLTLEIVLPSWARTKDGSNSIILSYRVDGNHDGEISLGGSNFFDWEHALCLESTGEPCTDDRLDAYCTSTMRTCVRTDVDLDISEISLASLPISKGATFEFGFNASMEIHRIGIPDSFLDSVNSESTTIELAVLPSDLLRMLLDIGSRGDPLVREFSLCDVREYGPYCQQSVTFSNDEEDGLSKFAEDFSTNLNMYIKAEARKQGEEKSEIGELDFSGLEIEARIPQSGLIDQDKEVVSDEIGIVLSVRIPKVRMTVGLDNSWGEIFSMARGGEEEPRLGVSTDKVANVLVAPFLEPMVGAMGALTGALAGGMVDANGISIPGNISSQVPSEITDVIGPEELGFRLSGEVEMMMPSGIFLRDISSKNNLVSHEIDEATGKQVITYMLSPDSTTDVVTFGVDLAWGWMFAQVAYYLIALLLLFMFRVRRRSVKRKRIRRAEELEKLSQAAEGSAGVYVPPQPTVEVLKVADNGIVVKKRLAIG